MVTYGTTVIPSDQINVIAGASVVASAAFENTVGLIGGMDTDNGTATTGERARVSSPSQAADMFGEGSELHEQAQLAFQNGAGVVYALPVPETTVTAETKSTSSGTLDNAPVFDPRVHDEHTITVEDTTTGSIEVEYADEPSPSAPSTSDAVRIYPPTGEYTADAAPDGDYEFTYDYGDYSVDTIKPLIDQSPRIIGLLTESVSTVNDTVGELNSRATNFDFMHLVAGAQPSISDTANYSNSLSERRASVAYPSRGYRDTAETNEQRVAGAIAGYLAALPLGLSSTNDELGGFVSLRNGLAGPQEAGDVRDEGVMPLLNYPPVTIVQDMTTSDEPKFERIYTMQIVDEATEISHEINKEFVGDQNTQSNQNALRGSHETAYLDMEVGTPKMLDGFDVNTETDPNDPKKVNVSIALDVVDVMDTIDVTITVGNIVTNNGAS